MSDKTALSKLRDNPPSAKRLGRGMESLTAEEVSAARPTVAKAVDEVDPWRRPNPESNRRQAAALRMQIEPLETQLKAALQSKNGTKAEALREKLKAIRGRVAQLEPDAPILSEKDAAAILQRFPVDD